MNIDLIYSKTLGIEINDDSWTLAYLGRTFSSITLCGHAVIPAKKLPFADKDEEKDFLGKIERFFLETGVDTDNIIVGLPCSSVIYKTINIPAAKKRDIPSIMSFEIARHIPFPIEEAYCDYQILEQKGSQFLVMIAIARKTVVDAYLEIFERIEIKPSVFYTNTFGLLNGFAAAGRLQKDRNTAVISIYPDNVNIHTVMDGTVSATRMLPIDKQGMWLKHLENIIRALPLGMDAREKKFDHIFIISSVPDKEIPENIKDALNANSSIENPLKDVIKGDFAPETLPSITTAAGLALRGIGKGKIKLNLLPPAYRKPEGRGGIVTALILVSLIAIIGIGDVLSAVIKERLILRDIDRKLAALRPDINEVTALRKKILEIETKLKAIDAIKRKDASKLDIMAELANILPPDTWVTNMEYTKGELHISGLSGSASSLLSILEGSNLFENAEFVGSITSGVEGKERFRIKMRITGVKIGVSR